MEWRSIEVMSMNFQAHSRPSFAICCVLSKFLQYCLINNINWHDPECRIMPICRSVFLNPVLLLLESYFQKDVGMWLLPISHVLGHLWRENEQFGCCSWQILQPQLNAATVLRTKDKRSKKTNYNELWSFSKSVLDISAAMWIDDKAENITACHLSKNSKQEQKVLGGQTS